MVVQSFAWIPMLASACYRGGRIRNTESFWEALMVFLASHGKRLYLRHFRMRPGTLSPIDRLMMILAVWWWDTRGETGGADVCERTEQIDDRG